MCSNTAFRPPKDGSKRLGLKEYKVIVTIISFLLTEFSVAYLEHPNFMYFVKSHSLENDDN